MAITGIKYPVAAKLTNESYSAADYDEGILLGYALKADITIEGANGNDLHGSNGVIETDTSFGGGKVALNVDDISEEAYCYISGAGKATVLGKEVIRDSGADVAPYLGFGYYKTGKKNNVGYFTAQWYYKMQFGKPSESTETIKKQVTWQTPTIESPILTLGNGDWRDFARFANENEAIAWLRALAGLGAEADASALNAAIAEAEALDPEIYTSASWAQLAIDIKEAKGVVAAPYASQTMLDTAKTTLTTSKTALVSR